MVHHMGGLMLVVLGPAAASLQEAVLPGLKLLVPLLRLVWLSWDMWASHHRVYQCLVSSSSSKERVRSLFTGDKFISGCVCCNLSKLSTKTNCCK